MLKRDKKLLCTPGMNRKTLMKQEKCPSADIQISTSVFMKVPVIVVGRHDYDTYRDSLDRLKDTGFEIGTISIEPETELAQARQLIQKLLADHQMLPYEPGKDWRFLDYVSNSEEGTFRLSRHQEHNHAVSDICNVDECIILQDDAFPSMTARSAAIGHDLVFAPANCSMSNEEDTTTTDSPSTSYSLFDEQQQKQKSVIEENENNNDLPHNGAAALTPTDIEKLFAFTSLEDITAATAIPSIQHEQEETTKKKKRKRSVKFFFNFWKKKSTETKII
uniref:Uncharacterized protein n=1 Tax=Panagrolaimus sp. ES5 TaxID=591445 RepID=A0AC34GT96_9BILA